MGAKRLTILGATGGLGQHVLVAALEAGHRVRAHVRTPAKLARQHERLEIVQGDLSDGDSIRGAIAGCDAVLSCVGYAKGQDPAVYGQGLQHVVDGMDEHGVRRLVAISGAGLQLEGDTATLGRFFITTLLKIFGRHVLAGKQAEWEVIHRSSVDWTLARVPRMVTGEPSGGVAVDLAQVSGRPMVAYADVAAWMLQQLDDPTYVGKAPFVSGT